ncbi:phage tail protein [Zooshikella marina]|uniref:phage tail protein n=1 Tax=Zooshikella ganghwensis TaxID=202772 RepID=UPI001BAF6935|nr:phage tail protein [Zooshikella ganghwensis]MBU2708083.1 phage tail protein [Zooshikella ganghwensis]
MNIEYYNLLTEVGTAKLTNATLMGDTLKLTTIKVGDGGVDEGKETFPSETATSLVRERWSGNITHLSIDPENKNWVVAEAVIPVDVGGFYITEFGLYDHQGDLICIGKYPKTYKPKVQQNSGSASSLYLKVVLEISSSKNIELKIDPAIVLASRQYVKDNYVPKTGGLFEADIHVVGDIYAGEKHNQRVYHEGYKPTKVDVGLDQLPNAKTDAVDVNTSDKLATARAVYNIAESSKRLYIQGIRLGAVQHGVIWRNVGISDRSGFVITGVTNGPPADDLVDVVYARPLQKLVNGQWLTVSSI